MHPLLDEAAVVERIRATRPHATHWCKNCFNVFDLADIPRGQTFTVECCLRPSLAMMDHPAVTEALKNAPVASQHGWGPFQWGTIRDNHGVMYFAGFAYLMRRGHLISIVFNYIRKPKKAPPTKDAQI